jgi:hypothetical protein
VDLPSVNVSSDTRETRGSSSSVGVSKNKNQPTSTENLPSTSSQSLPSTSTENPCLRILEQFLSMHGKPEVIAKYITGANTNAIESANFIMIAMMEKRLFSPNGVRYDICAMAVCLFLNEGGFKGLYSALLIDLGIPPTAFQEDRLAQLENKGLLKRKQKLRYPKRVPKNKKLRRLQAKKYKGLDLGEYGKKPHAGRAPRRCGFCKAVGHDRRNCELLKNKRSEENNVEFD